MKKINFLLIFVLFLTTSCGDLGKVLRNEKIRTTDEFLVKKKGPLVLPPDYETIPEPGSITKKEISQEEKIKKILKGPKLDKKKNTNTKSIEKSILEKIKE